MKDIHEMKQRNRLLHFVILRMGGQSVRALDLLRQVYKEIGTLESLRRQRDMVMADNAGLKAIRYDSEKVSGGKQGDLSDVLLNIEKQRRRIDEQIAYQLERVMRHRAELYQLIEKVPDGPGKIAVQEHYLYRVPWVVVAERLRFNKGYIRELAHRTVGELEKVLSD